MKIVKDTPFEFGFLVAQVRPPRPSLTVVVKATFSIVHGDRSVLAATQSPCSGDVHWDDDPARSLVYDSDLAIRKTRGECTLVGTCHVPGGVPQKVSGAAFKVGPVTKAMAVFGDRVWVRRALMSVPGEPQPFTAMPLTWEKAFGGPGFDANPVGMGIVPQETTSGPQNVLPNIEDPDKLLRSMGTRPDPVGCGPISRFWTARATRTGTVDSAWARTRWPALPEDFDWGYFNAAPMDQQIEGFWRGDEEILLRNLHPQQALVQTRLPGRRARCFITESGRVREVPLNLDTLAIHSDAGTITAVWRGVTEVVSDKLTEVQKLFLMDEDLAEQSTVQACVARMAAMDTAEVAEEKAFEGEVPPTTVAELPPLVPAMPRAEIEARLGRDESLAGEDLTGSDLAGLDLSGRDLTRAVLQGSKLAGAVLVGASLVGAVLEGASLAGAQLGGARLARADFTGADLTGADLTGADLTGAILEGAKMKGAVLRGATLRGVEAHGVDLTEADLREAVMDKGDFTGATLDRARLVGASLVECTLEGASGAQVAMDNCDLTRLRASEGVKFPDASLRGARGKGSRWGGAMLDRATLSFADLERADFSGASLVSATLSGCRLRGVRFGEAKLAGASLVKADAMEADFEAADLTRADLRGANLFGANFWRARTEGARMDLANITRTRLA